MAQLGTCPVCRNPFAIAVPEGESIDVACPSCSAEFSTADAAIAHLPEAILIVDPPAPTGVPEVPACGAERIEADPAFDCCCIVDEGPPDSIGMAAPSEAGKPELAFPSSVARGFSPSLARRRRSPLRTMVGIFGGGVVGLVIGYYILLWFGGRDHDFLQIGDRLPAWSLPADFREPAVDSNWIRDTSRRMRRAESFPAGDRRNEPQEAPRLSDDQPAQP